MDFGGYLFQKQQIYFHKFWVHHTVIFQLDLHKTLRWGYRGVGTDKCQPRHDCSLFYGTNFKMIKRKLLSIMNHLLRFSSVLFASARGKYTSHRVNWIWMCIYIYIWHILILWSKPLSVLENKKTHTRNVG